MTILLLTLNPTAGSTRQPFHAAFFDHCLKGATKVSCWLSEPSFERLVPPSWLEFLEYGWKHAKVARAMEFFMSNGFARHQAAGMVGNLLHESKLKPTARGDSGGSRGIAQWRGRRFRELREFARNRGEPWQDFETQLEFIIHELDNDESHARQRLLGAKSVKAAARAFGRHYLRPKRVEEVRCRHAARAFHM